MAIGICAKCAKVFLIIFNFLFWLSGLGLVGIGTWLLVDPRRSYLLDLVHLSEGDPLLKIACYMFIAIGCVTIVVGFLGCCGALKEVQCMLVAYVVFLFLILAAELSAGILAIIFKDRIKSTFKDRFYNMTHWEYGRKVWVNDVVDQVQYWQQCCGAMGPMDYNGSWFQVNYVEEAKLVYVPESCCKQQVDSWPDKLKSVNRDDCMFMDGGNESRYNEGCYQKLMDFFNNHSIVFIAIAIAVATFQLLGVSFAICLCRNVGEEI